MSLHLALQPICQGALLILILLFSRLQEKEEKIFTGSLQKKKPQGLDPVYCYCSTSTLNQEENRRQQLLNSSPSTCCQSP